MCDASNFKTNGTDFNVPWSLFVIEPGKDFNKLYSYIYCCYSHDI